MGQQLQQEQAYYNDPSNENARVMKVRRDYVAGTTTKSSTRSSYAIKQPPIGISASFHCTTNQRFSYHDYNGNDNTAVDANSNANHVTNDNHARPNHGYNANPAHDRYASAVARSYSDLSGSSWGGNILHEEDPRIMHNHHHHHSGNPPGNSSSRSAPSGPVLSSCCSSSSTRWGGVRLDPEVKRKSRLASYKAIAFEAKMRVSMRKSFRWIKDKYLEVVHGSTKINALDASNASP